MRNRFRQFAACIVLAFASLGAFAQYSLDEVGAGMGVGYGKFLNQEQSLGGPAFHGQAFYGHFFCGKAYGIHASAGLTVYNPSTAEGAPFLNDSTAGKSKMLFAGLDAGFYFKVKAKDYHRPREMALLFGPKLYLPFVARYSNQGNSGALSEVAETVSAFQAGAHLSVQLRRPAGEKSYFIQPGVEYYFLPAFSNSPAGEVRQLYIFLQLGFAFWDKRG